MSIKRESNLERKVIYILKSSGFSDPVREYRFHPVRMWRFDFAYPDRKIAIECEGGIWTRGAHTRGNHYNSDLEKYNAAVILGWKVLRYSTNTLETLGNELSSLLRHNL